MKLGVTILARHRDRSRYVFISWHDGLLLLPGGGVKEYESLADAAVREFREETGLTLDEYHFFTVHEMIQPPQSGPDPTLWAGDHKVLIAFLGNCSGMPVPGDDAKEVHFYSPNEIKRGRREHSFSPVTAALLGQVGDLK